MKHRILVAAFGACLILALPALAQQPQEPPPIDARLSGPMVRAQAAEITLRDALIKALQEDTARREQDLAAWFKGWFEGPK